MLVLFDIYKRAQHYEISYHIELHDDVVRAACVNETSYLCVELVRLLHEDSRQYCRRQLLTFEANSERMMTTVAATGGYRLLRSLLRNMYFTQIKMGQHTMFFKQLPAATLKHFYKVVEDFRCRPPITSIDDVYHWRVDI